MEKVYLKMMYWEFIGDNVSLWKSAYESMGDTECGYGIFYVKHTDLQI